MDTNVSAMMSATSRLGSVRQIWISSGECDEQSVDESKDVKLFCSSNDFLSLGKIKIDKHYAIFLANSHQCC